MSSSLRFGSTLSMLAVAAVLSSCASPTARKASIYDGNLKSSNLALATRAQAALAANDYATAVDLSERAVEKSPNDAGFRALLGNAYFASGRFASAEAAYKDALSLLSGQPQIVLKLALVQIARGKRDEARAFLDAAREVINPSDYGLALALAGNPADAVGVLEQVARQPAADAQVRQNLALAYALAGDWTAARTIAAQDLSADLVDARIQQWMAFASPKSASDQVASLVGVTPAASDPGQPTRLALHKSDTRQAEANPVAQPAPPQVEMSAAEPAPVVTDIVPPPPVEVAAAPEPTFVAPPPLPAAEPKAEPPVRAASFGPKRAPFRKAALSLARGKLGYVMQLGAYSSRERVSVAWETITKRYPALRGYAPASARFDGPRGTVYRLSVSGFAGGGEAIARCQQLRRNGGNCFVRRTAGDKPVQFASR